MPNLDVIIAVSIAGLLLSLSPGPSMLYVLSRSVGQSRSAGLASTVGLAIGGIVLAVASAMGLIAIVRYSPNLYIAIQMCGAAYLFYLGITLILSANKADMQVYQVQDQSHSSIVIQGIFVEILNPKTALFFLAFIPQFVDYSRQDVSLQLLYLSILVPLTAIPSDVLVSVGGGSVAARLANHPTFGIWLGRISGLVLIALAARLLFI